METTVNLQEAFHNNPVWFILAGLAAITLILIIIFYKREKKAAPQVVQNQRMVFKPHYDRQSALSDIYRLQNELNYGHMEVRDAYGHVSMILRNYVYTMTGVQVTSFTLNEINALGIPALTSLIAECYPPEFSEMATGDVRATLDKTKRFIEGWR